MVFGSWFMVAEPLDYQVPLKPGFGSPPVMSFCIKTIQYRNGARNLLMD
jgi:hypothetical protein